MQGAGELWLTTTGTIRDALRRQFRVRGAPAVHDVASSCWRSGRLEELRVVVDPLWLEVLELDDPGPICERVTAFLNFFGLPNVSVDAIVHPKEVLNAY